MIPTSIKVDLLGLRTERDAYAWYSYLWKMWQKAYFSRKKCPHIYIFRGKNSFTVVFGKHRINLNYVAINQTELR